MRLPSRAGSLALTVVVASGIAVAVPTLSSAGAPAPLSAGKAATASSLEGSGYAASKAVDGRSRTRWASAEGIDPQWLRVDLGAVHRIDRVTVDWEAAYATSYRLETSTDGRTWTTVRSTTQGDGGRDELTGLGATGRYVRLLGLRRGTPYGYSVYEFSVYGSSDPVTTPTSSAPTSSSATAAPSTTRVPSTTAPSTTRAPSTTAPSTTAPSTTRSSTSSRTSDLADPHLKDIAMQLVSSAENSSLDWKAQYAYVEDIGDGRGYTSGIIGFTTGTGDALELVELYTRRVPGNPLASYLSALRAVNGTASHSGLSGYPEAWRRAAATAEFRTAQDDLRDSMYFDPAVNQAKADGLRALGQFVYYDAIVMHGPGDDGVSFGGIRAAALRKAKPPAAGGDETAYLNAFLDARAAAMRTEEAHSDTSRVDTAQRVFLAAGNLDLRPPLRWKVYGDPYEILS